MNKEHSYNITIDWTGNRGEGTQSYTGYDRSHSLLIENKENVLCSSDPAFRGDKTKHNPEEFLVASLSSCHMLWYLHLCADAGVIVEEYSDNASGKMIETTDTGGHFTEVTLNPSIVVSEQSMVEKAMELHDKAHHLCFIANSVNFPVKHNPVVTARNI